MAVTATSECSNSSRQRSSSASMPSIHRSRNTFMPRSSMRMDWRMLKTITGSMALSCSWPASAARVTVRSLPITWKAIWLITSGITGLTFPGMIDEPGCIAGSLISPKPARGPLLRRRRSLQILESLTAMRFRTPENVTKAPMSDVASIKSPAGTRSTPDILERCLMAASE